MRTSRAVRDAREMAEAAARLLNEPEEEEEPPPPPPHPPPYAPASLEDFGSDSSDEPPPPPPPRDDRRPPSVRAGGRAEADTPSARDARTPKPGHRRAASGGHSRTHSDGSGKGGHTRTGSGGVLARGSAGLKEKLSSMAQSFGVRGEAIETAEAIWAELKPHTEVPIARARDRSGTFLIWQVPHHLPYLAGAQGERDGGGGLAPALDVRPAAREGPPRPRR